MNFYKDFYIKGHLSDTQIQYLEKILEMPCIEKLKHIIPESAKLFGRDCEDIVLYDAQTIAVGMAYINPYFFIGDKPGLGKTIMSAAIYAHYRKKAKEENQPISKLLVVTDNNHVEGISKDYKRCGITLVPLYGGTDKINRTIKKFDINDSEIDGIATSWDSLKVNGFLMYYLEVKDKLLFGIFDETSALKSDKTQTFKQADLIASNMDRIVFLNASPFETSIMDMFNQFKVLNPTILPTKKFIYDRYVKNGERTWFETRYVTNNKGIKIPKRIKRKAFMISDYVNQEELRERLKFHYIARTKQDFGNDAPNHIYKLHPVKMTEKMATMLSNFGLTMYREILNSPATLKNGYKITTKTVPKLQVLLDLFESIAHERPVIYCFNIESQKAIQKELKDRGYSLPIISGQINKDGETRLKILEDFKNGEYDGLIINIEKAINIYGSEAMIFYDIPTNPQITYQLMGRIDRNNFTKSRSYHFLVYLHSPEMQNMIDLAYFREIHSSKFTGQPEDVYKQLLSQLECYL